MMKTEHSTDESVAPAGVRATETAVSVFGWLQLFNARNLGLMVLLAAIMVSALAVVNTSFKSRTVFHELQTLRAESNELDVQQGQLLIEQSTFGLEGRIEQKAMEELDMTLPDWSRIIMVRHE
ncbi:MAG: cell division protein FtsL [Gammaproteobacteria bacterium]|nr:cell division protein FtsL [Gammaproteobacteria bacterium]|tara:strand:+ start:637 stop:1005 length:369 start_codon:yes stop_codon:yes gene_type:complete